MLRELPPLNRTHQRTDISHNEHTKNWNSLAHLANFFLTNIFYHESEPQWNLPYKFPPKVDHIKFQLFIEKTFYSLSRLFKLQTLKVSSKSVKRKFVKMALKHGSLTLKNIFEFTAHSNWLKIIIVPLIWLSSVIHIWICLNLSFEILKVKWFNNMNWSVPYRFKVGSF